MFRSHSHGGRSLKEINRMKKKIEKASPGLLADPENARLFEEILQPTITEYQADAIDVKYCKNNKDNL